jgi:hypothetical protein
LVGSLGLTAPQLAERFRTGDGEIEKCNDGCV